MLAILTMGVSLLSGCASIMLYKLYVNRMIRRHPLKLNASCVFQIISPDTIHDYFADIVTGLRFEVHGVVFPTLCRRTVEHLSLVALGSIDLMLFSYD